MATLKQRMWRKNNAGTYDTIHLETESSLVLRPSGRTVEQDLTDFLPEVQATDDVPETLKRRKLIVGNTKAFVLDKSILLSDTYSYGISDLTAGSSTLATGTLYFVYE